MKKNIITTLNHYGYGIDKSSIKTEQLNKLKEKLTVKPTYGDFANEEDCEAFPVFQEDESHIYIPRYYGQDNYGEPKTTNLECDNINITFSGKLRDNQLDLVDKCYNTFIKSGGGLLAVGCGSGKTTMALYLACKLKVKTLVMVHKSFLQDQWIDRAKNFTDAKIGSIRGPDIDIEDKDIVIGMIQSVSMKDYDDDIFKQFGFIIYDEAHHCASRVFSQALFKTIGKYTLALSATPDRPDGLTKIMHWFLGPTIFKQKNKPNRQVLVKRFVFNTSTERNKEKFKELTQRLPNGKVKPSLPKIINNLVKIKERNKHILNIINELRKYPERKILILSGRIKHLEKLKSKVDAKIKREVEKGKLTENEIQTFFYIGKMKKKERKLAEENADIIFASYEMAHEGLDIERLNTVILSTPKKNIIQSVGRVMRKLLKEGDLRPLIIDMCDNIPCLKYQGEKRITQYRANKYNVTNYYLENDKILSLEEFMKKEHKLTDEEAKLYVDKDEEYNPVLSEILDLETIDLEEDKEEEMENINENKKVEFTDYLF